MKKILILLLTTILLLPSISWANADCREVYQGKLLNQEAWRARRSALSVFVGAFAISPLVTPLGAATFGSFAVALLASGSGMHYLNKKKLILPAAAKELMLMDEVLNPGLSLHLEDYTSQVLFGRKVGYKYDFLPETKMKLFQAFVLHLKKKASRTGYDDQEVEQITDASVRDIMGRLMNDGLALCQAPKGKVKALMMYRFENVILRNMLPELLY